ncbi:hypothetical protein PInf_001224 [Phytophthora infestans]|nr:hypothetical protein PInf_001224 [Phytophthora infestans]
MKMSITAIVVHLSIWCRSCQPTIVPVVDDGTSDEFNVANRSFRAGDDHIWTPLEKPDGVNGALELYSHNMTPTKKGWKSRQQQILSDVARNLDAWEPRASYFSASMNRIWPYSYDECDADVFNPSFQRISACDDNPGYGLNPNQGRGAPEIDVLDGGGLQLLFVLLHCLTPGANFIDVPTAYYGKERGHKSWYQGLRYAANNYCKQNAEEKQDYATFAASVKAGITENTCAVDTCPASGDLNAELSLIVGKGKDHWGINSNGTCYPLINSYMGSYLCDPDNMFSKCASPRNESTTPKSNAISAFNYQIDAISSKLAYISARKNGYVRWMLHGEPLFEVTTDSIEPLYVIFNVSLSSSWCATPPNPGKECRGDGKDPVTNVICDSFPMYMKIDHIRLYQDLATDLEADNYMQVGCDPASHPTQEWIEAHIDEYEDNDNKWEEVAGKAFCETSDDCTIGGTLSRTALKTGKLFK